jgi:hypothetical protein
VGHFGLRNRDDWHHFLASQEENFFSLYENQVSSLWTPGWFAFYRALKNGQLLIFLPVGGLVTIKNVHMNVLAGLVQILLASHIKDSGSKALQIGS